MMRALDFVVDLEPADAERMIALFGDQFECDLESIRSAALRVEALLGEVRP